MAPPSSCYRALLYAIIGTAFATALLAASIFVLVQVVIYRFRESKPPPLPIAPSIIVTMEGGGRRRVGSDELCQPGRRIGGRRGRGGGGGGRGGGRGGEGGRVGRGGGRADRGIGVREELVDGEEFECFEEGAKGEEYVSSEVGDCASSTVVGEEGEASSAEVVGGGGEKGAIGEEYVSSEVGECAPSRVVRVGGEEGKASSAEVVRGGGGEKGGINSVRGKKLKKEEGAIGEEYVSSEVGECAPSRVVRVGEEEGKASSAKVGGGGREKGSVRGKKLKKVSSAVVAREGREKVSSVERTYSAGAGVGQLGGVEEEQEGD